MEKLTPKTLFGRLALLLISALTISQLLSFQMMFEVLGPPHPPEHPPLAGGHPPDFHWPMLFDLGFRLVALTMAAWFAARWLSAPLLGMANAARDLGRNVMGPALPESGPLEYKTTAQVFNQMQAQIQLQLREKDRFVAAVSHDLRTPLTRLTLRTESIENPELQTRMRHDIAEMNAMITATLDYLRGEADSEPWIRMDLISILDSIAQDYQDAGKSVILLQNATSSTETERLPVWTQTSALRRGLTNLIDNAVRYGGSAELDWYDNANDVFVRIRDHGPGIPETKLEHVFLPFYRLEGSRNRSSGGVGLGLAITKDIAAQLGGQIELKNAANGGLEAILRLPRTDRNQPGKRADPEN